MGEIQRFDDSPLTPLELMYRNRVLDGYYDLVMYGPPAWTQTSRIIYPDIKKIYRKYCIVSVPSFEFKGEEDARDFTFLIFKDSKRCKEFYRGMIKDYNRNFQKLCEVTPSGWKVIEKTFRLNNYDISKKCEKKDDFNFNERNKFRFSDILLVILLYYPVFHSLKFIAKE